MACTFTVSAQKEELIDSLKSRLNSWEPNDQTKANLYNQISESYYHLDFDSSDFYAVKALQLSKTLGFESGLAEAYKNKGYVYIPWSRYDSARAYLDSSLAISQKMNLDRLDIALVRVQVDQ